MKAIKQPSYIMRQTTEAIKQKRKTLGVQMGLESNSSGESIGSASRKDVSRTADTMAKNPAFLFALSDTTQSRSADTHKPISKNNPTPTPKTNALISPS